MFPETMDSRSDPSHGSAAHISDNLEIAFAPRRYIVSITIKGIIQRI